MPASSDVLEAATLSFRAGAYARTIDLLFPAQLRPDGTLVVPRWTEDDTLLVPDAGALSLEVRELLLLLAAAARLPGQAPTWAAPLGAALRGCLWDWQAPEDQQLIELALYLHGETLPAAESGPSSEAQPEPPEVYPPLQDDLSQGLAFEFGLALLRAGLVPQAASLLRPLQGDLREVLSALIALQDEQPLSPATTSLLLRYADHPGVGRARSGLGRRLHVNLLSGTATEQGRDLVLTLGRGWSAPHRTLAAMVLLSERALSYEELSEALGMTSKPGVVMMTLRGVLGEAAIEKEKVGTRSLFRLSSELQVGSDIQDLEQRARHHPLAVLGQLQERLTVLEDTLPYFVRERLMAVIEQATGALSRADFEAGGQLLADLVPVSPDLDRLLRLIDRHAERQEGAGV